jgi:polar amino acid transport system permease protein
MAKKWEIFVDLFINKEGYTMVLEGLRNTAIIAVLGLLIGIVIGTLIAIVHVTPKYRRLPRVLERIVNVYVAFFRGTPMVVQLLVG